MIKKYKSLNEKYIYDIIIIGCGISGLYTAYKLLLKNKDLKILILEKNNYIGGRIKTTYLNFKSKKFTYENGAGRLNENHKLFLQLINDLSLSNKLIEISGDVEFINDKNYSMPKKFKNKTMFDYLDIVIEKSKGVKKENLIKYSFIDYASQILNKDEIQFLKESSGSYYGRLVFANAYNSLKIFKTGIRGDIPYFILRDGFSTITKKLTKIIEEKNTVIKINNDVKEIIESNNIFKIKSNNDYYNSKKVIYAGNKESLLRFNYLKKYNKTIDSICSESLLRIYSIFDEIWFKNYGKITTNNKLRFIIPIDKKGGLIMISYCDNKYATYWKKIFEKKKLNKEIVNNVNEIFSKNIKEPVYTDFCYWEYGKNYWKPNVNSTKINNRIMKLDKNKEFYIIGETYSENQGWIEGALENSEKLIKKYF